MRTVSIFSRLIALTSRSPSAVSTLTSANCNNKVWIHSSLKPERDSRRTFCGSAARTTSKVWNIGKINHVALATPDLKKSAKFYRNVLGANVSEEQPVPEHGVTVVFVKLGDTKIELLHPLGKKSPIQSFLEKNKDGGMHHICIEVDDIQLAMKEMKENKIRLLSETAKIGAHGKPVVFLHPKDCDGVLVELEEVKEA